MNYIKQLTNLKKWIPIAGTKQKTERKLLKSEGGGRKNELMFSGWGIKLVHL